MIASQLIVDLLPPIKPSETFGKALLWMSEFKVAHLPVVDGNDFKGILSEEEALDINNEEQQINESKTSLVPVFTYEFHHIFEVMKNMADHDLSVMPILDKNDNYIGCTTLAHLMRVISNVTSIGEPGGVIVLALNSRDYSLAQIAQIVESNNARILSSYITSLPDSTEMEVTIKVNKKELGAILQTFARYDYKVLQTYQRNEQFDELQNRFDNLMNMLDL